MKFAVVACTNGNFNIHTEHSDPTSAIMEFHGYCRALWADASTTRATVKIVDEQLDVYQGYSEFLNKEPEPEE